MIASTNTSKTIRNVKSLPKKEKKSVDKVVNQLLKEYVVSNREKQEIKTIIGILLDSGLSVEEKIKRIGRTSTSGLFVNIIKRSAIEFVNKHKQLLEIRKKVNQKKLSNGGILSIVLSDFFNNKINFIARSIKSHVDKTVHNSIVGLEYQEKIPNKENKETEKKVDNTNSISQHRQRDNQPFDIKKYLRKTKRAAFKTSCSEKLSQVEMLKKMRQDAAREYRPSK